MLEHDQYTYSDLIDLFLDGEADSVQQATLFAALSADTDLQAEFQEALEIRAAIEFDRQSTAPPAVLTNNVFQRAGFVPVAAGSRRAASVLGTRIRLMTAAGVALVAALFSSFLTAFILTQSNAIRDEAMNVARQQQLLSAAPEIATFTPGVRQTPVFAEQGETPPDRGGQPKSESNGPRLYRDRAPAFETSGSEQRRGQVSAAPIKTATRDYAPLPRAAAAARLADAYHYEATPMIDLPAKLGTDLAVQVRGITSLHLFPDRAATSSAHPWVNNMSLAALYRISEHSSLGLELGQEDFPLFVANDNNEFESKSRVFWIGGTFRTDFSNVAIAPGIHPFTQVLLAGTHSGPLGKASAGLCFRPDARVRFSLGLEGTTLLYGYRNRLYSAGKLGLNYMIHVDF